MSKPAQDTDETGEDDALSRETVASEGLPPSLLALFQPAIAASPASTGTGSSQAATSSSVKSMEMGEGGDASKTSEGDAAGIGAAHAGHGKIDLEGGEGGHSETSGKAADPFEGFEFSPAGSDAVAAPLAAAPSTVTATGAAASATTVSPNTPSAASVPIPLGAVPMTIGLRSLAGTNHFEIRLDPKDLGRIDVALDIDKDNGTVKAHLVVDRAETLALLQRDADSLQQALSQAGLEAGDGSINLSLRSDQSGGRSQEERSRDGDARTGSASTAPVTESTLSPVIPLRSLRGLNGVDIRI